MELVVAPEYKIETVPEDEMVRDEVGSEELVMKKKRILAE